MATKYQQQGDVFFPTSEANLTPPLDILPLGTYTVVFNPKLGFYLQVIDSYTLGKIYGDIPQKAERILNTFEDRPAGTGVLLSGEKGCGKTMLAKKLSIEGAKRGIITIVINQPLRGEDFNKFIQAIQQPAVILFDEYEKVYDKEAQEQLLTLLDGVYNSKKLFVLTSNDKYRVNEYMLNRPGRIFYNLEYNALEEAFVREYCEDNLKNKEHLAGVVNLSTIIPKFNFDMLKAAVEEMNRYNEPANLAIQMMNIKVTSYNQNFTWALTINDVKQAYNKRESEVINVDPMGRFFTHYHDARIAAALEERLKAAKKAVNKPQRTNEDVDEDEELYKLLEEGGEVDYDDDCRPVMIQANQPEGLSLPNNSAVEWKTDHLVRVDGGSYLYEQVIKGETYRLQLTKSVVAQTGSWRDAL